MMDILINGKKMDYEIENEKTVGEVLGSVETACEQSGMTITAISVDGSVVPANMLDALFERDLAGISLIELETLSGTDVLNMLHELGNRFTVCVPLLREIPVQLQTGKDLPVMETIHSFSLDLQNLYKLLPLLGITGLPAEGPGVDGIPLGSYPSELSPVLSELLEALEKKDTVLAGDLSEYELAPRIERLGAVLSAV